MFTKKRLALGAAIAVVATTGVATDGFGALTDPVMAKRIDVVIDGNLIASFNDFTVTSEIEPSEYWEVDGTSSQLNKLSGKLKPPQIVLKHAMTTSPVLWAWMDSVRSGGMAGVRRTVSITVYNAAGKPTAKFWLENGWPIKLHADMEGASTTDGTPVVEDVTLSGEYVKRVAP